MKTRLQIYLSALLGQEKLQRKILLNTLAATLVCLMSSVIQCIGVVAGNVPFVHAALLIGMLLSSQVFFYTAIRSGWSTRFADPAMSMAHMVYIILCLGAAYLINPLIRGVLLMLAAFVLSFGAFALSPRNCRQLGCLCLVILGLAMSIGTTWRPAEFPLFIEAIAFVCSAVTMPLIGFLSGQHSQTQRDLRLQRRQLNEALDQVNMMATRDELTGLPNRRRMREHVEHEIKQAQCGSGMLCIGMLDLDHFKAVNDQRGHAAGDAVLVNFALQARMLLRETDVLARWGGEEFLLICPNSSLEDALQAIERLRTHLNRPETWVEAPAERVTFSAGIALHEPSASFERTVSLADAALYQAKREGRNRCIAARSSETAAVALES